MQRGVTGKRLSFSAAAAPMRMPVVRCVTCIKYAFATSLQQPPTTLCIRYQAGFDALFCMDRPRDCALLLVIEANSKQLDRQGTVTLSCSCGDARCSAASLQPLSVHGRKFPTAGRDPEGRRCFLMDVFEGGAPRHPLILADLRLGIEGGAPHLRLASSIFSVSSSSVHSSPRRHRYSAYAHALGEGLSSAGCSRVDTLAMLLRSAAISSERSRPRSSPKQLSAANTLSSDSLSPACSAWRCT